MSQKVPLNETNIDFDAIRYKWENMTNSEFDKEFYSLLKKLEIAQNLGLSKTIENINAILEAYNLYHEERYY